MKHIFSVLVVIFLLASCGSYKTKQQISAISFPELGSITKDNGALWYQTSEQVGVPVYDNPVKVNAQLGYQIYYN